MLDAKQGNSKGLWVNACTKVSKVSLPLTSMKTQCTFSGNRRGLETAFPHKSTTRTIIGFNDNQCGY